MSGRRLLLACLLGWLPAAGAAARGQVVEVSAGMSTAVDVEGGQLTIHGENSETTIGAGLSQGRFVAGGATARRWHDGLLTAGQQQMRLDVPTDVFENAHLLAGVGLGYRGENVTVFAGTSAPEGGTPLFRTAERLRGAVGAAQVRRRGERCTGVGTVQVGSADWFTGGDDEKQPGAQEIALASVECRAHAGLTLAATAGTGGGAPYLAESVRYETHMLNVRAAYFSAGRDFSRAADALLALPEPAGANVEVTAKPGRRWSLNAAHERFRLAGLRGADGAEESSINQVGAGYQRHSLVASVTLLRSSYVSAGYAGQNEGATVGLTRQVRAMRLTESVFASRSVGTAGGWDVLSVTGVEARVSGRLRVSEAVNVSGGQATLSHGGEVLLERGSARVDYEMFYSPLQAGHPFQQAMVFSAQLRLVRRLILSGQSSVDALGRTVYSFRVGTEFSRQGMAGGERVMRTGMGRYMVRGRVVDGAGEPVEGAALMIAGQRLYTDVTGEFEYRDNRRAARELRVATDEFLDGGRWTVISSPARVMAEETGPEVRIVVTRGAV